MIGKLKGIVDSVAEDALILDVGGVGYRVFVSARALANTQPGQALALVIETHVREDHIHLYGFVSEEERQWFLTLTTVQGVGVKMGLALLSALSTAQLATAIAAGDTASLTRVSGVGPKLASRMVTELKNKVASLPIDGRDAGLPAHAAATSSAGGSSKKSAKAAPAPIKPSFAEDATSALVNLGYGRSEAFTAVAKAQQQAPAESLDALIKAALKELVR